MGRISRRVITNFSRSIRRILPDAPSNVMTTIRYTTFLYLFLLSTYGLAQTQKGNWMVGGDGFLNYRFQPSPIPSERTVRINPRVGYFVGRNVAVGVYASFADQAQYLRNGTFLLLGETRDLVVNKLVDRRIGLTPFVRSYAGQTALRPFFQVGVTYQRYIDKLYLGTASTPTQNGNGGWLVSGGIGVAYFIDNHLNLEATLNGAFGGFNSVDANRLGVDIGLNYFLVRRREE